MAKSSRRLDDIQIKHWIAKGEAIARSDGDGLTFTLSPSGTATWVLRYRLGGKRRKEVTIGNYPDISLAEARKKAQRVRVAVDEGADPALEKQSAKMRVMRAWLIRDLIADYQQCVLLTSNYAAGTIYYRQADYKKIILPKLGNRPVCEVTATDIVHILKNCGRSWVVCKRILTSLSQLMDHAVGQSIIVANPCLGIRLRSVKGPRPPVKKRVMLSREELVTLLKASDEIGYENSLALRILLATCVRSVELVKAKWEHIDFDRATWWIPDESVKTRAGFLVPLTPTVIHWFRQLQALADESTYVLPARRPDLKKGEEKHIGRTTLWAALTRAFERGQLDVTRFTPHDTRSTAKGHMRNLGVSREISEIALNHKLKGMEGIYDVRQEIPERRSALELWARFLVDCELGEEKPALNNVIPFRHKAA